MRCTKCLLTPPENHCTKDCETCDHNTPMDIPYPCCMCLRHEEDQRDTGTPLERWIKSEVEFYASIVTEGPLDRYSPDGYRRLVRVFAIAQRLSKRLIQKKTMMETDDPALHERITHYTTLYDNTLRYVTADDYDTLEDTLVEVHLTLHQLMVFFNKHYNLNYNLKPQTTDKNTPLETQLTQIQKTIENGGRPRTC